MREHEAWADALKGIAMCGVLMIHSGANSLPGPAGKLGEAGARGVQLFFLISAYFTFVSLSCIFEKETTTAGFKRICSWWIKRLVKLIPLWYTALFFYLMLLPDGEAYWLASRGRISAANILAHVFLLHGLNPYYINSILGIEWYLADLSLFYLIAPLLYRRITNLKRSLCFLVFTAAGGIFIRQAAYAWIPETDAYLYEMYINTVWLFAQLPVFAVGICLYHLKQKVCGFAGVRHKRRLSYGMLAFFLCMTGILIYGENRLPQMAEYTVFALCFAGMIISQMLYSCPVIVNPIFRKIGQKSYPVYLFHFLLLKLYDRYITFSFHNPWADWFMRFAVVFGLAYCIAAVTEKCIDRPVLCWYEKVVHKTS